MREGERHDHLRRLPPGYYRGQACVHWSLTMEDRKTGWLIPIFYCKFREILAHTTYRFGFCCPIYCCMPEHIHLLWVGILDTCDQRKAMRYFRKQLKPVLDVLKTKFQEQPYDHVLREEECKKTALEDVAEYIARNPERSGIVSADRFSEYPFTGCMVPGYPEVKPFEDQYWNRLWRIYSHLRTNGLQIV